MRLGIKTSAFFLAGIVALIAGLFVASKVTVFGAFADAEREEARTKALRAAEVADVVVSDFALRAVADWANWTGLADFATAPDKEWADENLAAASVGGLGWHTISIYSAPPGEKPKLQHSGEVKGTEYVPVPAALTRLIEERLLDGASTHAPAKYGFVRVGGTTYAIASLPTKTSDRKPPKVPGRLVATLLVDEAWVERLERYTRLDLSLTPLDALPETRRASLPAPGVATDRPAATETDNVGAVVLPDFSGTPTLLLEVTAPRSLSKHGARVLESSMVSLGVGGTLLLLLAVLLMRGAVISPLQRLLDGVRRLEEGKHQAVGMTSRDEIGTLGAAFDRMAARILEREEALQRTLGRLWTEMELAKRIQTALLPPEPRMPGGLLECHMEPAEEVGGDYYDVIDSESGRWLAIGDVSGHGVTSGLVMMMAHTAIRTAIQEESSRHGASASPARVLASVNSVLLESVGRLDAGKYMTISLLRQVSPGQFVHAGLHLDLLVYRRATERLEPIATSGMWLGVTEGIAQHLTDETFTLAPGDILLMHTDGITEAMRDGELFGEARLHEAVSAAARNGGAAEVRAAVLAALEGWKCHDDVSLVVLERLEEDKVQRAESLLSAGVA